MKRLLIVSTLALASLLPAAASGQLLTFQLSPELLDFIAAAPAADDLAAGEGKFRSGNTPIQFTLSAHGSPTDARGHAQIRVGAIEAKGEVDCLFVLGNRAAASGTAFNRSSGVPIIFAVVVEDNGEPSANNPTRDRASILTSASFDPGPDCALAFSLPFLLPLEQGNVVVMDRP
jgi:hypothetical protein